MALPTLDATFASAADLPRRQMLAKWLVNLQYSGLIEDYYTLPEKYLYAKIAVAAGGSRSEADYISLPDRYVWSDIYKAVSGSSADTIDRGEKEALGWIAAAVRGDEADPAKVATYISWPWRYQVASIITSLAVDANAQSFVATSGATDIEGIDQFVKGVKNLGLWDSMVCWPLRSMQNAGTGTTAYSLGGLGTFNGTLVNGPTWGAEGVDMEASSCHILTTLAFSQPVTIFSVFKTSANFGSGTAQRIHGPNTQNSLTRSNGNLSDFITVFANAGSTAALFNTAINTRSSTQLEFNGSSSSLSINGGAKITISTGSNANSGFIIGDATTRGALTSFVAVFTQSNVSPLHNLYKISLGTDLGLV